MTRPHVLLLLMALAVIGLATEITAFWILGAVFTMAGLANREQRNLSGELLLDFNLIFRLDDSGLRDKVTPLIGLEYSM